MGWQVSIYFWSNPTNTFVSFQCFKVKVCGKRLVNQRKSLKIFVLPVTKLRAYVIEKWLLSCFLSIAKKKKSRRRSEEWCCVVFFFRYKIQFENSTKWSNPDHFSHFETFIGKSREFVSDSSGELKCIFNRDNCRRPRRSSQFWKNSAKMSHWSNFYPTKLLNFWPRACYGTSRS